MNLKWNGNNPRDKRYSTNFRQHGDQESSGLKFTSICYPWISTPPFAACLCFLRCTDMAPHYNHRVQVPIKKKKEALKLLGYNADGSHHAAELNVASGQRWNNQTISQKYNVSKPTVSVWRSNARKIMSIDTSKKSQRKSVRVHCGKHVDLENCLLIYLRECIRYMNHQTLFRGNLLR